MNTGQMLLVIGALTLLTIMSLSVNTLILSKTTTILQAEAELTAISIAQSMLDEIKTKYFDQRVAYDSVKVYNLSLMTHPSAFGPSGVEAGKVPLPEPPDTVVPYKSMKKSNYDDVDDYHNYRRFYYSYALGLFTVVDSVYYVLESNPDQVSGTQTFVKRIVVTVRHRNLAPAEASYNQWTSRYYLQLADIAIYRRYY
ncbi:MAG: hypothetical protein QME52_06685 [Bacteroidota bacterium]|nr:hypothetical protein [Bacteroidota bacterium]